MLLYVYELRGRWLVADRVSFSYLFVFGHELSKAGSGAKATVQLFI
jgi:hypothetical protein